jgi:DNA uptake protein ComE-like DNA-binding protein
MASETDSHPHSETGRNRRLRDRIAERLREMGELVESRDEHPFRAQAYRRAAETVAQGTPETNSDADVLEVLQREGTEGLRRLPNIGPTVATAIAQMVRTGRWRALERLRAERGGAQLFATLPGMGPRLAQRLCDTIGCESLEELERAAHDGRLDQVPGFGPKRVAMIRAALAERLKRVRAGDAVQQEPSVQTLLEVDADYRRRAEQGTLRTIAPRRFNPEQRAWLPILETRREGWRFTALYSNTANAHRAGKTHDWVVLYFRDAQGREGQRTVVTETRGPLAGQRVVRGREAECRRLRRGQSEA